MVERPIESETPILREIKKIQKSSSRAKKTKTKKLILYKKTKGTEFNSSDEEKFLRRLNQNRVPTYICWPYKVPGQKGSKGAETFAGPGVCGCVGPGGWEGGVPF